MKDLCIILVDVLRFAECTEGWGKEKKIIKSVHLQEYVTGIEAKAHSGAKGTLPPRPGY